MWIFIEGVRSPRNDGDRTPSILDPAVGSEIRVLNEDSINRLPPRNVVPIIDGKSTSVALPWFVPLVATSANGLIKDSGADACQVKFLSEVRFKPCLGTIDAAQVDEIASAVALYVEAPCRRSRTWPASAPD